MTNNFTLLDFVDYLQISIYEIYQKCAYIHTYQLMRIMKARILDYLFCRIAFISFNY